MRCTDQETVFSIDFDVSLSFLLFGPCSVPVLKNKIQSPLLPHRRLQSTRPQDSSDEEMLASEDELGASIGGSGVSMINGTVEAGKTTANATTHNRFTNIENFADGMTQSLLCNELVNSKVDHVCNTGQSKKGENVELDSVL